MPDSRENAPSVSQAPEVQETINGFFHIGTGSVELDGGVQGTLFLKLSEHDLLMGVVLIDFIISSESKKALSSALISVVVIFQ